MDSDRKKKIFAETYKISKALLDASRECSMNSDLGLNDEVMALILGSATYVAGMIAAIDAMGHGNDTKKLVIESIEKTTKIFDIIPDPENFLHLPN